MVYRALFLVGKSGWWYIGHYFGWVGVSGGRWSIILGGLENILGRWG